MAFLSPDFKKKFLANLLMTGRVYNVCRIPNTVNSAVHTVQGLAL